MLLKSRPLANCCKAMNRSWLLVTELMVLPWKDECVFKLNKRGETHVVHKVGGENLHKFEQVKKKYGRL